MDHMAKSYRVWIGKVYSDLKRLDHYEGKFSGKNIWDNQVSMGLSYDEYLNLKAGKEPTTGGASHTDSDYFLIRRET